MKGFVLAAGLGQRMRPITDTIPKPLLPVGHLPLIGYAIALLKHHGITDLIVNVHHLGKSVREHLGDGERLGVHITYSEEEELLGTGGALRKMRDHLGDDTFVVVNSDAIVEVDLHAAIASHRRAEALATMVLRHDPRQAEFGQIEIDAHGRIRRILGHGDASRPLTQLMFTGVHVIEPRFLEYIPPDVNTCIVRYAYTKALNNDEALHGFLAEGYFADAGTPERYHQVNVDALDQRLRLPHADPLDGFALAPRRDVAEVVRMGKDVELGQNVRILPPVLLGDRVEVGDNATIGPYAILEAGAHVGKDATVTHSVLLDHARVDADAHVTHRLVSRKAWLSLRDEAGK